MPPLHRTSRAERASGFTLVELLVVIGIIAVLISMLLPVLSKVRQEAIRVQCAANMRTWGQALIGYHGDNKGRLFNPYSDGAAPGIMFIFNDAWPWAGQAGIDSRRELTTERMAQYLGGFTEVTDRATVMAGSDNQDTVGGAWLCPAVNGQQAALPGWFWPGFAKAAWMNYAYFGNVGSWQKDGGVPPTPDNLVDLVDNQLAADRVLMNDLMWFVETAPPPYNWFYNHARSGSAHSVFGADDGPNGYVGSLDDFAGMNELFGDGHVVWKNRDDLRVDLLKSNPVGQPHAGLSGSPGTTAYYATDR